MKLSRNNDTGREGFSHKFTIKYITCPTTDSFESSNEIKYEKRRDQHRKVNLRTVVAFQEIESDSDAIKTLNPIQSKSNSYRLCKKEYGESCAGS